MSFSEEKIDKLKQIYPYLTNKKLAILFHTSVASMEQFGYKYSLKKDPILLSIVRYHARNRKTKDKIEMEQVEKITSMTDWFRSFSFGESKTAQLETAEQCHTLSVLLSRWNLSEGLEKGMRLKSSTDLRNRTVTLFAVHCNEEK